MGTPHLDLDGTPEAAAAGEEVPPVGVEGKPASSLLAPRGRWKCEPAPTIVKVLKPAESITLNADEVGDEQETVGIVTEHVTLELLITADGFFGTVRLSGQEEGRAAFRLAADPKKLAWSLAVGKGEGKISCWPVRGFTATADEAGLSLELESVSWAVVLQAADVGPDGLEVSCDDLTGVLYNGQRMDSRRTGEDEVVFVISGQDWSREPTPWGIAQTKREDGPRTAGEPQQAAHGPLRPWQTLFLPVIEVGVLRPEDVSP